MLEDINELLLAHERSPSEQGRVTVLRYALVALHSFDELAGRFQADLRTGKFGVGVRGDSKRLFDSLSSYHRVLGPFRSDLAGIRHTLGAHRGLPSTKEQKRFRKQFEAWGEWESTLAGLETKCDRSRWQAVLEAAFDLHNIINQVDLGQWYSTADDMFRLYTPIRLAETDRLPDDGPDPPHSKRVQRTRSVRRIRTVDTRSRCCEGAIMPREQIIDRVARETGYSPTVVQRVMTEGLQALHRTAFCEAEGVSAALLDCYFSFGPQAAYHLGGILEEARVGCDPDLPWSETFLRIDSAACNRYSMYIREWLSQRSQQRKALDEQRTDRGGTDDD